MFRIQALTNSRTRSTIIRSSNGQFSTICQWDYQRGNDPSCSDADKPIKEYKTLKSAKRWIEDRFLDDSDFGSFRIVCPDESYMMMFKEWTTVVGGDVPQVYGDKKYHVEQLIFVSPIRRDMAVKWTPTRVFGSFSLARDYLERGKSPLASNIGMYRVVCPDGSYLVRYRHWYHICGRRVIVGWEE